ncbi:MAG: hypothetical protein RLZZ319_300, partial [Actinomycetota bacterium]
TDVGVRLPAHLTASGRAMLAQLPPEQIRALYPDDSALSSRGGSPSTRRQLREVLRETRQRGFAIERGDVTAGLSSIAVPILDRVGWPLAALALTFPDSAGDGAELVADVATAASDIARRLRV